jgi:hypothetical protein
VVSQVRGHGDNVRVFRKSASQLTLIQGGVRGSHVVVHVGKVNNAIVRDNVGLYTTNGEYGENDSDHSEMELHC